MSQNSGGKSQEDAYYERIMHTILQEEGLDGEFFDGGPGITARGKPTLTVSPIAIDHAYSVLDSMEQFFNNVDSSVLATMTIDDVSKIVTFDELQTQVSSLMDAPWDEVAILKKSVPVTVKNAMALPGKLLLNEVLSSGNRVLLYASSIYVFDRLNKARQVLTSNKNIYRAPDILFTDVECYNTAHDKYLESYSGSIFLFDPALGQVPDGTYDFIFVDSKIPSYCTKDTDAVYFFEIMFKKLNKGGVVAGILPDYSGAYSDVVANNHRHLSIREILSPNSIYQEGAVRVQFGGSEYLDPILSPQRLHQLGLKMGFDVFLEDIRTYFDARLANMVSPKRWKMSIEMKDLRYFRVLKISRNPFLQPAHSVHTSSRQLTFVKSTELDPRFKPIKGSPFSEHDLIAFDNNFIFSDKSDGVPVAAFLKPRDSKSPSKICVAQEGEEYHMEAMVDYTGPYVEFCAERIKDELIVYDVRYINGTATTGFISRYRAFHSVAEQYNLPLTFKRWFHPSCLHDKAQQWYREGKEGIVLQPLFSMYAVAIHKIIHNYVGPARYIKYEPSVDILKNGRVYRHYLSGDKEDEYRKDKLFPNSEAYSSFIKTLLPWQSYINVIGGQVAGDAINISSIIKIGPDASSFSPQILSAEEKKRLASSYPRELRFPDYATLDFKHAVYSMRYVMYCELLGDLCKRFNPTRLLKVADEYISDYD